MASGLAVCQDMVRWRWFRLSAADGEACGSCRRGRFATGRAFEIFRTRKTTRSRGVAGSDLLLDFAPRGAVGNIEIVPSLQSDPELR